MVLPFIVHFNCVYDLIAQLTAERDMKYREHGQVAQPKLQSQQRPLGSNTMEP